jgi:small subunit ribosomal protein S16
VLKIRLRRAGGKNHPFYRVVVIDSRKARDSRAVEEIGYYNPLEKPQVVNVDRERVDFWTGRGAQVSDTVKSLLRQENSTHPTRREVDSFEPAAPVEKPKPRKKAAAKAEAAPRAEAATAVAVEEAPEETPEAAPEAEAEAAPETQADGDKPAQDGA